MLGQNLQAFVKNCIFLAQIVSILEFLFQIQNQRPKIDYCAKFQPNWTKDKGAQISTLNATENCLMTSYLCHSDDVSKVSMLLTDFVPEYYHTHSGSEVPKLQKAVSFLHSLPCSAFFVREPLIQGISYEAWWQLDHK